MRTSPSIAENSLLLYRRQSATPHNPGRAACGTGVTHQVGQGLISFLLGCHGGLRPDCSLRFSAHGCRVSLVCCVREVVAVAAEAARREIVQPTQHWSFSSTDCFRPHKWLARANPDLASAIRPISRSITYSHVPLRESKSRLPVVFCAGS